jgi:hypothetical protein
VKVATELENFMAKSGRLLSIAQDNEKGLIVEAHENVREARQWN